MKVRCVKNDGWTSSLTLGREYEIIKENKENEEEKEDLESYFLVDDSGGKHWYIKKRFEIVPMESNSFCKKPPLGVMPEKIFELGRIQELCRALHEYTQQEKINLELVTIWAYELCDRLNKLKNEGVYEE